MPSLKQRVLGVFGSRFLAQASVDDIDVISQDFRLIALSSESFKGATMQPAAKVRLNAGNWDMRAYTPLSLDSVAGRVQLLAYLHGEGPGSMWAKSAVPGATTHIMGLQPSLDLADLCGPAVFFGDETSLAAAKTLQAHLTTSATRFIFEFSKAGAAQSVADRLKLNDVEFHGRQTDETHIPQVVEAIQRALASVGAPHLVLTGNGRSIQAIRTHLRTKHSGAIDYRVKAYWAPGKLGLE